ncbi:conserved hypothetical protein [Trichinella spiralis]|uniref:hypothetical protein n=1 Tax=Trichinella spiralis TaxID=6334 RepID=UPI0001EFE5EA|nr:conserved hypothetical protein [Trichinella spiralis]
MDPKSPRIVERLQCKLSCRTRRSYLSSSSTRRCMTRNLATSSSNSTIASDLSSSEMPSSRSCCELKQQRTGNETAANEQPGVQIAFTSCVHLSFLLARIYTCWLSWLCVLWPKSLMRNSVTWLVAQPLDLYDCVVLMNGIVPLCPVPISPNSSPYL